MMRLWGVLAVAALAAGCGDAPKGGTRSVSATASVSARGVESSTAPAETSAPNPAGAPAPAAPSRRTAAGADLAMVPPPATGRSPLERSPGYFPPDDPESASVRLGRREAKPVNEEFGGGAASLEDFAGRVLEGLNSRDEKMLHPLRVTRVEFERILWPEFPESRPITRITADDAWSLSEPRSLTAASRAIGLHGGKHLRLERVEHGAAQPFTNFDLYRGVTIIAADETSGEVHRITMAPSVAARHGRFKALLFRD